MSLSGIGDLRQHFLSTQNKTRVKTELNTLVEELTTGEKSDLTSHLGISQVGLNSLDRQLKVLGKYEQVNEQTSQILSTMQTILEHVDDLRSSASNTLLTISDSSTPLDLSRGSDAARTSFEATVQSLNTRYGDQSLFGGADVEGTPLATADQMLSELQTAIAGLTTATDVSIAVDAWFDDVGGGFETVGYLGDSTGVVERPLDANQFISIDARADDEAIKETLKALAKGALANDPSVSLDLAETRNLQQESAVGLLNAAENMADLQARVGFIEGRVEEASVRNSAEQTSYGIARSEMVSADPFETATRLEAVQLQLETQYTLTARLSRLSLTEYLR